MPDIFISYGRADRAKAQSLVTHLERRGWSIWWDRDLIAGDEYDRVIEENLDAARCVIVVWSKNSVASNWVKAEAAAGLENGRLLPVRVDDARVPLEFRRLQTIDFHTREKGDNPGRALTAAVARILGDDGADDDAASHDLDRVAAPLAVSRRVMHTAAFALLAAAGLATWVLLPDEPAVETAVTTDVSKSISPIPSPVARETPADSEPAARVDPNEARIEDLVLGIRADLEAGRVTPARERLQELEEADPHHKAKSSLERSIAALESTAARASQLRTELEQATTTEQISRPVQEAQALLALGGRLPQLEALSRAVADSRQRDAILVSCEELTINSVTADLATTLGVMLPRIQALRTSTTDTVGIAACTEAQSVLLARAGQLLARPPRAQEDVARYLDVLIQAEGEFAGMSTEAGLQSLTEAFCGKLEARLIEAPASEEARAASLQVFAVFPVLESGSAVSRLVDTAVAKLDWTADDEPAATERLTVLEPLLAQYEGGELGRHIGPRLADLRRIQSDAEEARVTAWRVAREQILQDGDLASARTYYLGLMDDYEKGSDMYLLARLGLADYDAQLATRLRGLDRQKVDPKKRLDLLEEAEEDLARLRPPDTLRSPDDESAAAYVIYRRAVLHSEMARVWASLVEGSPGMQTFRNHWEHHAIKRIPMLRNKLAQDHADERLTGGERFVDLANGLPTYRPRIR